jgi:hypothetical protein
MNAKLINAAQRALSADGFERQPHYCQRWVKEVIRSVYGDEFERYALPSAILSARKWKQSRHAVALTSGSVPGDILYKMHGSGGDGHVGIRLPGNIVAENSSVHWDGQDARGTRTMKEYGNFDLIVRIAS